MYTDFLDRHLIFMSQKCLSDLQSVYGAEVTEPFTVVITTPG